MGVDNIITFDAHDPRVVNSIPLHGFDNFTPPYQFIKSILTKEPDLTIDSDHMMVISPDEGSMGRAVYFANVIGVDMGMFYKRKDYSVMVNGNNPIIEHEFLGNNVEGKDVIVVDDMISSGESILDVAKELKNKLIHRHPHVFGDMKIDNADDVLAVWDKRKSEEKSHRKSAMDGISRSQSALISAQKISKKAVKTGFEWPNEDSLYDCIMSEFNEFKEAVQEGDKTHMEEEFGDILFATVNLARWNKIDAEQALLKANKKFEKRFRKMEELAEKPLNDYSFEEFDELWKQAKKVTAGE